MKRTYSIRFFSLLLLASLSTGGCVTQSYVDRRYEETLRQVDSLRLEQKRLDTLIAARFEGVESAVVNTIEGAYDDAAAARKEALAARAESTVAVRTARKVETEVEQSLADLEKHLTEQSQVLAEAQAIFSSTDIIGDEAGTAALAHTEKNKEAPLASPSSTEISSPLTSPTVQGAAKINTDAINADGKLEIAMQQHDGRGSKKTASIVQTHKHLTKDRVPQNDDIENVLQNHESSTIKVAERIYAAHIIRQIALSQTKQAPKQNDVLNSLDPLEGLLLERNADLTTLSTAEANQLDDLLNKIDGKEYEAITIIGFAAKEDPAQPGNSFDRAANSARQAYTYLVSRGIKRDKVISGGIEQVLQASDLPASPLKAGREGIAIRAWRLASNKDTILAWAQTE